MIKLLPLGTPGTNMFGIVDCPKCGDKYRWPSTDKHPTFPNHIICDKCGFMEPIEE